MKFKTMTEHQLLRKIGEQEAIIYWHQRGTFVKPEREIEKARGHRNALEIMHKHGIYVPELNANGNIIERFGLRCKDRYYFDFVYCKPEDGWKQYDTLRMRGTSACG